MKTRIFLILFPTFQFQIPHTTEGTDDYRLLIPIFLCIYITASSPVSTYVIWFVTTWSNPIWSNATLATAT